MPILNDILDHEVIGPAIMQGLNQGRQEGRQEGRREMFCHLLEKRFGLLPSWVPARLANLSATEHNEMASRVFDAARLEDLFSDKQ